MKCKHCGANIKIEVNFCPYCGGENTEYRLHRKQLFHLKNDYEQIKKRVMEENQRIASSSVKITTIAVLVALNLVLWILGANAWDIMRSYQVAVERKSIEVHREKLQEYEKNNNYGMLAAYYDEHVLYQIEELEEFRQVYQACSNFAYAYGFLLDLQNPDERYSQEENIRIVCDNLDYMYDAMLLKEYIDPKSYEGQHQVTMENLKKDVSYLLVTYGGITEEEAQRFDKMSDGQRQIALERGLELYED